HRDELEPDAGKRGRDLARQATAALASADDPMDKSLDDLAHALAKRTEGTPVPVKHRDAVGGGRAAGAIGAIDAGLAGKGNADLASKVEGTQIAIGSLAKTTETEAATATDEAGGKGAAPGVYRTNASLLAV